MHMLSMLGLLLVANLWFAPTPQDLGEPRLHQVHNVYVGDMGDDDEAGRFRLLVAEQVAKKGFAVVDAPEKADAILTGALAVRVHRNSSTARVYVTLQTLKGQRLWGRDFGSKMTNIFSLTEPVKLRAQDVANGLKQDWDKSAKLAPKK
jgi:hypothetical protein